MSYDEWDAMQDAGFEAMYQEIGPRWAEDHAQELFELNYDAAVEQFIRERLRSYYASHPDVAVPATDSLAYARSLLPTFPKAAFLFAAIATELAWKQVLLRPMVAGLVTLPTVAEVVTQLATAQQGFDRFGPFLIAMLTHLIGLDLKAAVRPNSSKPVSQEINEVSRLRNAILHAGADADELDARLAIELSEYLLGTVYAKIKRVLSVP